MELEFSLSYLQEPAICPGHEPDQSNLRPPTRFILYPF
jgi:hypothetical protein